MYKCHEAEEAPQREGVRLLASAAAFYFVPLYCLIDCHHFVIMCSYASC